MNLLRPLPLLPLVMLLAFLARWEPARVLQLAPDERDLGSSRWLLDEPETCEHLRRIELGIAAERVPEFDSFANHPSGAEIPALPVFDTLVAGLAQRCLQTSHGEPALGGVDEADLEDFAARLAPLLGVLATLAVFSAARALLDGPRRDLLALLAALVFALHPAAVHAASAGRLDAASLAAVILAFLLRSTVRALRSSERPAIVLDALIAGVLAGSCVATTAAGLFVFAPMWLGFLWLAFRGPEPRRVDAIRGALLFCAVSAFFSSLTRAQGPWEARSGAIVESFTSGVSTLLLFSTAPFLVAFLLRKGEKPRKFQVACFIAALAVMAWHVPRLWVDLKPAIGWLLGDGGAIAVVMPALRSRWPSLAELRDSRTGWTDLSGLVFDALAFLPAWIYLLRLERTAERTTLLALGLVTFVLSIAFVGTGALFAVALACTLAAALDAAFDDLRVRKVALAAAGAFVLVFALQSLAPALAKPDLAEREARIAFVSGLRWMRANTPAGGAWNSPRMVSTWGVLSSVADGALVEYHARRPALACPNAALSDLRGLFDCEEALAKDETRLVHYMHGQEARYVVVSPVVRRTRRDLVHVREPLGPTASADGSVRDRMAFAPESAAPDRIPGFERAYASPRRVGILGHAPEAGEPAGPAISIYKLSTPAPLLHEAELRAK